MHFHDKQYTTVTQHALRVDLATLPDRCTNHSCTRVHFLHSLSTLFNTAHTQTKACLAQAGIHCTTHQHCMPDQKQQLACRHLSLQQLQAQSTPNQHQYDNYRHATDDQLRILAAHSVLSISCQVFNCGRLTICRQAGTQAGRETQERMARHKVQKYTLPVHTLDV